MRIRWGLRPVMLVFAVLLFSLMMTLPIVAQQRQARPAGPPQPTPRRADGTVNLGSTEPNKGFFSGRQHWGYEEVLKDPKEGIPYQPWPKALIAFDLSWNPNGEIMEYICQENNLWLKRLLKQVPE